MTTAWHFLRALSVPVCVLGLVACSNGRGSLNDSGQQQEPGKVTIGGTIAGLSGSGLVLQNNGADDLAIASNGSFTFDTPLASGSTFEVTVATQPKLPSQTCTVADASGTIEGSDVRTVKVSCATNTFTIRGTVSGVAGSGLVLQNNGGDDVGVQSDGGFAFATRIPSGSAYDVTVKTQPANPPQACSVQNGSGVVADRDVEDLLITCVTREFTIGGTISGLVGSGLVLANNGSDQFSPTANGPFTFPTAVLSGRPYDVTVQVSPIRPLQFCRVSDGSGVVSDSNITNVAVSCTTIGFGVGGTVSGLQGAGLELQSNGEKLQIAANGKFLLPASLPDGTPYDLTISTQPANQVCTVGNGRGAIENADAAGVTVICR